MGNGLKLFSERRNHHNGPLLELVSVSFGVVVVVVVVYMLLLFRKMF